MVWNEVKGGHTGTEGALPRGKSISYKGVAFLPDPSSIFSDQGSPAQPGDSNPIAHGKVVLDSSSKDEGLAATEVSTGVSYAGAG